MKEMNKDLTAVTNLVTACRAASLALAKLEHTSEMQKDLRERLDKVKLHQETMEEMVFGKKSHVCKQDPPTQATHGQRYLTVRRISPTKLRAGPPPKMRPQDVGAYIVKHKEDFEAGYSKQ